MQNLKIATGVVATFLVVFVGFVAIFATIGNTTDSEVSTIERVSDAWWDFPTDSKIAICDMDADGIDDVFVDSYAPSDWSDYAAAREAWSLIVTNDCGM